MGGLEGKIWTTTRRPALNIHPFTPAQGHDGSAAV